MYTNAERSLLWGQVIGAAWGRSILGKNEEVFESCRQQQTPPLKRLQIGSWSKLCVLLHKQARSLVHVNADLVLELPELQRYDNQFSRSLRCNSPTSDLDVANLLPLSGLAALQLPPTSIGCLIKELIQKHSLAIEMQCGALLHTFILHYALLGQDVEQSESQYIEQGFQATRDWIVEYIDQREREHWEHWCWIYQQSLWILQNGHPLTEVQDFLSGVLKRQEPAQDFAYRVSISLPLALHITTLFSPTEKRLDVILKFARAFSAELPSLFALLGAYNGTVNWLKSIEEWMAGPLIKSRYLKHLPFPRDNELNPQLQLF